MTLYRRYSYPWITVLALYFFCRAGSGSEHFVFHIVLGVSQLVIAGWAYEQRRCGAKVSTDFWFIRIVKDFQFARINRMKTAFTLLSVFLMASLMFLMTYCFERCVVSDKQLADAAAPAAESQTAR